MQRLPIILAFVLLSSIGPSVVAYAVDAEDKSTKLFTAGFELLKAKKYEEAAKNFDAGLRINPNNSLAHFYDGIAYGYLNKHSDAQRHLYQSLALDPDGPIANQAWLIVSEMRRVQPLTLPKSK